MNKDAEKFASDLARSGDFSEPDGANRIEIEKALIAAMEWAYLDTLEICEEYENENGVNYVDCVMSKIEGRMK